MTDVVERLGSGLRTKFAIERELGAGGMATVYLARDLKNQREVAIKVLLPELSESVGVDRFLREIAIIGKLSHPHILTLYDSGKTNGLLYYVMPYVDGESLRARLDRETQLSIDDAIQITHEVGAALDHAHSQGVIHRDIKPENILFSGGQAVVADFGVARALTEAGGARLTQTGLAIGTPAYMSPEQAGAASVDGRSDVYSLACVLYEMLAGVPPFTGPTAQAIMARHALDSAPRIRSVRDTVPLPVEQAVMKALAKVPADRFATAGAFVKSLQGHVISIEVDAKASAIAVLDFANLSHDASLDWLCGGIAETVAADLKKTRQVSVIGRDRVSRIVSELGGGGEPDAVEVGRSLGARWVVSGGFQTAGGAVRITPRFVDTSTGEVVSAAKIDGSMDDLFKLQDRIVVALLEVLDIPISPAVAADIAQPQTQQLEAYELYAKGRQLVKEFGPTRFAEARDCFEEALRLDADYALAHAGLGHVDVFSYIQTTRHEDLESGISHLEKSLAIDPSLGEAYIWLTYGYIRQRRFADAEVAGSRAAKLEPDHALAHYFLGTGRLNRAMEEGDWYGIHSALPCLVRCLELDSSYGPANMALGWAYSLNGQHDTARRYIDWAVEIEEGGLGKEVSFVGGHTLRAGLVYRSGDVEQARHEYGLALQRLAGVDHMYRHAFEALSHCGLGECSYRERAYDEALNHFKQAIATVEQNPTRLGMGFHMVKARLGLARTCHALHMKQEASAQYELGRALFDQREGYDFHWMWEGADPHALFDFALYYAAVGDESEMGTALANAVDHGWGDLPWIESDPIFGRWRSGSVMEHIRRSVTERGQLPELVPTSLSNEART